MNNLKTIKSVSLAHSPVKVDLALEVVDMGNGVEEDYAANPNKVKDKIDEVLFMITILERVPTKFFKSIDGVKGLFEIRIEYESNIYIHYNRIINLILPIFKIAC